MATFFRKRLFFPGSTYHLQSVLTYIVGRKGSITVQPVARICGGYWLRKLNGDMNCSRVAWEG
jgi:hypothetical protein